MRELLQEYSDSRGVPMRVDREEGVIHGVKILGKQSRNGRRYPPEALTAAIALYENAKVNVNHPKGPPGAPRDYQDRIGSIRNVSYEPDRGLFADFHFNPKHALAEQLAWDAENSPENVGFSHNVEARTSRQGEQVVVEAILRVQSVDLVADPATTRGLFESEGLPDAVSTASNATENATSLSTRITTDADPATTSDNVQNTPAENISANATTGLNPAIILNKNQNTPAENISTQSNSSEIKTTTVEQLKARYPHLVAEIVREQKESNAALREELKNVSAQYARLTTADSIRRLLRQYKLPEPDDRSAEAKILLGNAFLESLAAVESEEERRTLVEERVRLIHALIEDGGLAAGVFGMRDPPADDAKTEPAGKPLSREPDAYSRTSPQNAKAFAKAIQG